MTPEAFTRLVQWWTKRWSDWELTRFVETIHPQVFDDLDRWCERTGKLARGISLALSNDYLRSVEYPFPIDEGPKNCSHGVPLSADCVECMKQHLEEVIR